MCFWVGICVVIASRWFHRIDRHQANCVLLEAGFNGWFVLALPHMRYIFQPLIPLQLPPAASQSPEQLECLVAVRAMIRRVGLPSYSSGRFEDSIIHVELENAQNGVRFAGEIFHTPNEFARFVEKTQPVLQNEAGEHTNRASGRLAVPQILCISVVPGWVQRQE